MSNECKSEFYSEEYYEVVIGYLNSELSMVVWESSIDDIYTVEDEIYDATV